MMTIPTKLRVPARCWWSIAGAICFLRLTAPVQADVTPVPKAGASTPFITLEAEAGELSAGARVQRFEHGSPVPPIATLELEASGGGLVELAATGAAVTWRNPVANANTIVIRSSIPNTPSGGGITATLDLYVDGKFRQAIPLSSKQSWGDGINLNNGNTPDPEKLGINLTAENNFVRGNGDDCLATYSDRGEKGANGQMVGSKFLNNTGSAPYWANCLRVAGGKEVVVRNNLLMDSASNCGMTVGIFGKTGHALESALIEGNVILRGGGWNGKDRHGLAVGSRPGRHEMWAPVRFRKEAANVRIGIGHTRATGLDLCDRLSGIVRSQVQQGQVAMCGFEDWLKYSKVGLHGISAVREF